MERTLKKYLKLCTCLTNPEDVGKEGTLCYVLRHWHGTCRLSCIKATGIHSLQLTLRFFHPVFLSGLCLVLTFLAGTFCTKQIGFSELFKPHTSNYLSWKSGNRVWYHGGRNCGHIEVTVSGTLFPEDPHQCLTCRCLLPTSGNRHPILMVTTIWIIALRPWHSFCHVPGT